ncbi:MAG: cytochrome bd ubiquinol oxidase subunit [Solirubrobacteraceae bacterium]|nr:cytochrome bd ubiquinol oxidase subunit [Solirubrobacteraceae bacterium]MEA2242285.1 cytochrome bd ubiquinol oxidase subunit [Solirubrobacteraceae bacterium]
MSSHVTVDRLQFTLTVTFHYLFPVLTMGLALFVAWMKTVAYLGREQHRLRPLRKTDAQRRTYDGAAQFFATIFAVTFAVGVVTGIPLEFQFGTNWAAFSNYAGGVIGQTLAMEGVFAFFAESAFIGVFLAGRGRVGERLHWISALMLLAGSWISGFFIIATNAWMQHPVAYTLHHGRAQLNSLWELLTNPWLPWQYAHNMSGAAVTGAFVIAGLGAFYRLLGRHPEFSRACLSVGVSGALIFSTLQIFPTGDRHARMVARYQPSSFAAMEALFQTQKGAPLVIIGNPDTEHRKLDSAIEMPRALSFLTSQRWNTQLRGLDDIPTDRWPDSVPLVYYAYHIMVGLGTILLIVALLAVLLLRRGRLLRSRTMLWALMLAVPFTYIANIAGWTVAETGRQPWIVFGLMRTPAGASPASSVPAGTGIFTLLGFAGLYLLIGIVYVLLIVRIVARGPREGTIAPVAPAAMTAA